MDNFYNYINSVTPISEATWTEFKKILELKRYARKTPLCKIGIFPTLSFFVLEGYARGFFSTENGKFFNREIFGPREFMASLSALTDNTKSALGLECLTDCVIIQANFKAFMKMTKSNTELQNLYKKILEKNFNKLEQRTVQLSTLDAKERYLALQLRIPNIDNEISQYHIASHLGITPIQLSRIRRGLFLT